MQDPDNVSGTCTRCFTGFGHYHEPECPYYEPKVVIDTDIKSDIDGTDTTQ